MSNKCDLYVELLKTVDVFDIEYCPSCGVHAPWVNGCRKDEEW